MSDAKLRQLIARIVHQKMQTAVDREIRKVVKFTVSFAGQDAQPT